MSSVQIQKAVEEERERCARLVETLAASLRADAAEIERSGKLAAPQYEKAMSLFRTPDHYRHAAKLIDIVAKAIRRIP